MFIQVTFSKIVFNYIFNFHLLLSLESIKTYCRGFGASLSIGYDLFRLIKNHLQKINRKLKFETLEYCIFPALLYSCHIWTLSEKQRVTIQTCQRKMHREILGITLQDRMTNEITETNKQLRRSRTDHDDGVQMGRTLDETTHVGHHVGPIHREEGPGETKAQWPEMFRKTADKQWTRKARDRTLWKELGKSMKEESVV